jgi:hypothetical protein
MKNINNGAVNYYSFKYVTVAGIVAGLAEVLWVLGLAAFIILDAGNVAREVTASLFPALLESGFSIVLGIAIHLALSVLLVVAYFGSIGRWVEKHFNLSGQLTIAISALIIVWAINVLLILPVINPLFNNTIAYSFSLVSKILFAITMVLSIRYFRSK